MNFSFRSYYICLYYTTFFKKHKFKHYINKSKHDIFMIDKIKKPCVNPEALIYAISSFLTSRLDKVKEILNYFAIG